MWTAPPAALPLLSALRWVPDAGSSKGRGRRRHWGPLAPSAPTALMLVSLDLVWSTGTSLIKSSDSALANRERLIVTLSRVTFELPRELVGRFAFVEMALAGPTLEAAAITMNGARQATFVRQSSGVSWFVDPGYYTMGNYPPALVQTIVNALKAGTSISDLTRIATQTITSQMAIDQTVGGPIDIAVIEPSGTRWVEVKPNCR